MSPAARSGSSGRDRRALLVGGGAVLVVLLWVAGVSPWLAAHGDATLRLERERTLLEAERQLVAAREEYFAAAEEARNRLDRLSDRLLPAGRGGAATAELSRYVQEQAEASRVLVSRTSPGPTEPVDDGIVAVSVEIEGESDLEGIATFLRRLEGSGLLLHVDGLRIGQAGLTGGPEGAWERLSLSLEVTGFVLSREEAGPDQALLEAVR